MVGGDGAAALLISVFVKSHRLLKLIVQFEFRTAEINFISLLHLLMNSGFFLFLFNFFIEGTKFIKNGSNIPESNQVEPNKK